MHVTIVKYNFYSENNINQVYYIKNNSDIILWREMLIICTWNIQLWELVSDIFAYWSYNISYIPKHKLNHNWSVTMIPYIIISHIFKMLIPQCSNVCAFTKYNNNCKHSYQSTSHFKCRSLSESIIQWTICLNETKYLTCFLECRV